MARNVGVWIDYSECVISFPDEGEYIRRILSRAGLRLGVNAEKTANPVTRDPRVGIRLDKYYMEIINSIHSADAVVVFGPDDARTELKDHMEKVGMGDRVLTVEEMPKVSTPQIVEKIAEWFESAATSVGK